jgi:uncharacterized membrane protein
MKTLLLIVLATFSTTVGEVLLAKGMKEVGDVSQLEWWQLWRMLRMFTNLKVVIGVLCMAAFFFSYAAVLSWADLSLVLPTTALSIVLATWIAFQWLGEGVSGWRWTGVVIIMMGIFIVWLDESRVGFVRRPMTTDATPDPAVEAPQPLRRAAGE